MNCHHCGAENTDQARFCQACGKALEPATAAVVPPAARRTGGHKLAALCIWIVAAILVLLVLANGVPASEARACIDQGGSGQQCRGFTPLQLVFGVLAFLAAGLGVRYWSKK